MSPRSAGRGALGSLYPPSKRREEGGHLHFLQLFVMRKTRASSSSVSRTPAKKAKTRCSLLSWRRKGADDPPGCLRAFPKAGRAAFSTGGLIPEIACALVRSLSLSAPVFNFWLLGLCEASMKAGGSLPAQTSFAGACTWHVLSISLRDS